MRTIRTNCFETNSSSTHSVTIDSSSERELNVAGTKVYPSEFGWKWNRFNDFATKASYFWTLVIDHPQDHDDLKCRIERLAEKNRFSLEPSKDSSYCYVDHGWEHYDEFISKYSELNTDDGLFNFLTSKSCWIMLGNDNSHGEPNFRLTPFQVENATSYLILNDEPPLRYAMIGHMSEEHYAVEAVYTWRERNKTIDEQIKEGWIKIIDVSCGEVKCAIEKYDCQTSETSIVKKFTLTYTIEHNAKYLATSL